uniref:tRNA(His) guanylyltransferase n=1 Tax=Populus davidiana TaxID=266767 RepID=A0A6M2F7G0_9ROSI
MANSKYEYVKSFEVEDEIMFPNLIVVRIGDRHFQRFSEVHEFEKPNDEKALKLMSLCATLVLQEYPDIVFSFGFSDEYSFVFKQTTKFYQRRASKVVSIIVSFFTSVYVTKWKEFFPEKELKYPPSFHARPIVCASLEVLQEYLAWRQQHCHITNQYNTCLWELVKSGKTEKEALEILKGTQKQERNELLFQHFGINYRTLPQMFRQGTCVLRTEVEDIVKYSENGTPIKRMRRDTTTVHSKSIAGRSFWNEHQSLLKELGGFTKDVGKINSDYIRSFLFESKLMASTWIVIRIDGCHFHRFSEVHDFEKPNDEQALNLMNSCAVAVLQEFPDVVFSYGVSDEYSFVLKKDSQFCQRKASNIVSIMVSFFTSMYVMNWKAFLPQKELKYCPAFDGRAVCYPSTEILQDYLAWRQVDCHINNQYNTCFWMLVKSGKSKSEAQRTLKGTQAQEKKELLAWFGIDDYNALPVMFRQGSSVFRDGMAPNENGAASKNRCYKVIIEHCNIIEQSFWEEHPGILG